MKVATGKTSQPRSIQSKTETQQRLEEQPENEFIT